MTDREQTDDSWAYYSGDVRYDAQVDEELDRRDGLMNQTQSSYRFVPQLLAAIERHEECENWCTWDNVVIAADAVKGEELAQKHLDEDAPWQLDAEGRLPE